MKLLKYIGWKNYRNKWQWTEVFVDLAVFAAIGFIAWWLF